MSLKSAVAKLERSPAARCDSKATVVIRGHKQADGSLPPIPSDAVPCSRCGQHHPLYVLRDPNFYGTEARLKTLATAGE